MDDEAFGRYRLVAEIGRGGMADVFLAFAVEDAPSLPPPPPLVIKRVRRDLSENPTFVSMFIDEARLASRLEHENVVRTTDVGEVQGRHFLAMELLEGQSLHRIQERARKTGVDLSALEYFALQDILSGLHYAHELRDDEMESATNLGVVHRDVGPHNVIVLYTGMAKLVDFGIAKAKRRVSQTTGGVIKGKVRYMAPEQALSLSVDRRADIFSAGVMIWEVAAQRPFWPDDVDDVTVAVRLAQGDYPASPRDAGVNVPDAIDALCKKALARDPAERHATAAALRDELVAFLDAGAADRATTRTTLGAKVAELFSSERRTQTELIETRRAPVPATSVQASRDPDRETAPSVPPPRRPATQRVALISVTLVALAATAAAFASSTLFAPAAVQAPDATANPNANPNATPTPNPTATATPTATPTPTTQIPSANTNKPLTVSSSTVSGSTVSSSMVSGTGSVARTAAPAASATTTVDPHTVIGRSHLDRDPDPWAPSRSSPSGSAPR